MGFDHCIIVLDPSGTPDINIVDFYFVGIVGPIARPLILGVSGPVWPGAFATTISQLPSFLSFEG